MQTSFCSGEDQGIPLRTARHALKYHGEDTLSRTFARLGILRYYGAL